jgi:hypothetical protein
MTPTNVFYQAEGLREIQHLEAQADHTVAVLKEVILGRHGLKIETFIFLEDADDPLDETVLIATLIKTRDVKLHVHGCRHIEVQVAFAGKTVKHRFAPSATIARVKKWATEHFGMTPDDASEHMLQIVGTHDRPAAGTHLGTLAVCPVCHISFDLVPDQRVNG